MQGGVLASNPMYFFFMKLIKHYYLAGKLLCIHGLLNEIKVAWRNINIYLFTLNVHLNLINIIYNNTIISELFSSLLT